MEESTKVVAASLHLLGRVILSAIQKPSGLPLSPWLLVPARPGAERFREELPELGGLVLPALPHFAGSSRSTAALSSLVAPSAAAAPPEGAGGKL